MWHDFAYSFRMIAKNLRFTALAVATLALGIGAATAVFVVFDAALIRPLPVREPERLVVFTKIAPDGDSDGSFAYPIYRDLRDRAQAVVDPVAYWLTHVSVDAGKQAERLRVELVSGNYFATLGVQTERGRLLTPDDDRVAGGHPVAVMSYGHWQRSHGKADSVLGSTIRINGFPFIVVGITAPGFHGFTVGAPAALQVPIAMQGQVSPDWQVLERSSTSWHRIFGRLEPGVTMAGAQSAMNVAFQQITRERLPALGALPASVRNEILAERLSVEPGARGFSTVRARYLQPLRILMGVVALLLLIACANFANLLLARGMSRGKEIALREALGAGRVRLVRQLVLESVILALLGGAAALVPAVALAAILLSLLPSGTSPPELVIGLDARVVVFSITVSILTGVFFGALPGWISSRVDLTSVLKAVGAQAGHPRATRRVGASLVVMQLALAIVLLAGAGVLARTLYNLKNVDLGFRQENVLLFSLNPSEIGYTKKTAPALYDRVLTAIEATSGVRAATVCLVDVLSGGGRRETIAVPGYASRPGETMNVDVNIVGPRYVETLGVPLVMGRDLTRADSAGSRRVAIVNETFVRRFFGSQHPLGREVYFGQTQSDASGLQVVGVVADTKYHAIREASVPVMYIPLSQEPADNLTVYVSTTVPPTNIFPALRRQVANVDARVAVFNVRTLAQQVDDALVQERLLATLSSVVGVVALVLAVIGLYGIVSYNVSRRVREIVLRMALGADRRTVLSLLLRETGGVLFVGVVAGCTAAALLLHVLREQLYGVSPLDPSTAIAAIAVVGSIGITAGVIPAMHASRCDPASVLRIE
jgi:predicted permease